ncbi:MAG: hypothetical protein WAQ75_02960, partial [Propionicimonas sp.]
MTDQGSSGPRRALGPLPDDVPAGPQGSSPARASRAFGSPDEDDTVIAGTRGFPRLTGSPESPSSPAEPTRRLAPSTPVPPPAPVLPEPVTGLPASAGRRFSASAEPSELVGAPRRSAASVSSPH